MHRRQSQKEQEYCVIFTASTRHPYAKTLIPSLNIYSRTSLNRTPRDRPKLFGLTDFRFIRFIYKEHIETGTSETVRFKR